MRKEVAYKEKIVSSDQDENNLIRAKANAKDIIEDENIDVSYSKSPVTLSRDYNNNITRKGSCIIIVNKDYDGLDNLFFMKKVENGVKVLKLCKLTFDPNLDDYCNQELYINSFYITKDNGSVESYSLSETVDNVNPSIINYVYNEEGDALINSLSYDASYSGLNSVKINGLVNIKLEIINSTGNISTRTIPILEGYDDDSSSVEENTIDDTFFIELKGA